MLFQSKNRLNGETCDLPPRKEALEALLVLAWRKCKKERPTWLINDLNRYC